MTNDRRESDCCSLNGIYELSWFDTSSTLAAGIRASIFSVGEEDGKRNAVRVIDSSLPISAIEGVKTAVHEQESWPCFVIFLPTACQYNLVGRACQLHGGGLEAVPWYFHLFSG